MFYLYCKNIIRRCRFGNSCYSRFQKVFINSLNFMGNM